MTYAVVAQYRCEPADEATVSAALLTMRGHTLTEPGNLAYVVHAETGRPGGFLLYEQYTDRAAFEAHTAADYFEELVVRTVRPVLTERVVTFADVL